VPDQRRILVDRGGGVEVVLDRRQVQILVGRLLGDVDAPQVADAVAVVGLVAGGDVELVPFGKNLFGVAR